MLDSAVLVLGVLAESVETGMILKRFLVLREQQLQIVAFWKESSVFTCLTYKNVQRFRNGPVHEFYSLKAS